MSVQEILAAIGERLGGAAAVRTIYGEPISAEGRTIVQVASVGYGFGAGAGGRGVGGAPSGGPSEEGGGGGAGVRVRPVGVVEVSASGTRFLAFGDRKKLAAAAASGFLAGWWLGNHRR